MRANYSKEKKKKEKKRKENRLALTWSVGKLESRKHIGIS